MQLGIHSLGPESVPCFSASQELDISSSDHFLSQLEFHAVNPLPIRAYICLMGGLLAILDLEELAFQPSTDELSKDSSLVMGVGQHLLDIVGRYGHSLSTVFSCLLYYSNEFYQTVS